MDVVREAKTFVELLHMLLGLFASSLGSVCVKRLIRLHRVDYMIPHAKKGQCIGGHSTLDPGAFKTQITPGAFKNLSKLRLS